MFLFSSTKILYSKMHVRELLEIQSSKEDRKQIIDLKLTVVWDHYSVLYLNKLESEQASGMVKHSYLKPMNFLLALYKTWKNKQITVIVTLIIIWTSPMEIITGNILNTILHQITRLKFSKREVRQSDVKVATSTHTFGYNTHCFTH